MFNVTLYSLSKKENSTRLPSGGTSFNCKLKSPCGVVNPTLEFNVGLNTPPTNYNYCFIPQFNRYYWIEEWVNDGALWYASMNVDVLATYKDEIGNSDLYILRSSASWDGNVVDSFYPNKTLTSVGDITISRPHAQTPAQGGFVLGVVGQSPIPSSVSQYGSIYYIYITRQGLTTLCTALMNSENMAQWGFELLDCSYELQKSLINPIDYIKSAIWLPYSWEGTITGGTLKINDWEIPNVQYVTLGNIKLTDRKAVTINLPKHPNTSLRGNYLNTSPFTNLWLNIPPYGVVELDTTITANATTITLSETLDFLTGKSILDVICNNVIINQLSSVVGVPIQLSQITRDYLSAISSGVSAVSSGISNLLNLNIGGAITSGVSGIADSTRAMSPKQTTTGSGGSYLDVMHEWYLSYEFLLPVDDDINMCGRPLCQIRKPKNLNGYMLVQEGDVSANATSFELAKIKNYLEGGFYYE